MSQNTNAVEVFYSVLLNCFLSMHLYFTAMESLSTEAWFWRRHVVTSVHWHMPSCHSHDSSFQEKILERVSSLQCCLYLFCSHSVPSTHWKGLLAPHSNETCFCQISNHSFLFLSHCLCLKVWTQLSLGSLPLLGFFIFSLAVTAQSPH